MLESLVSLPAIISYIVIAGMAYWVLGTKPSKAPPGPPGLPFIGYAPFLGKYPWLGLAKLKEKYGRIMSLYMGPELAIVLQDYDAIKAAFVDQEDIFAARGDEFVSQYFASGTDGKVHGIISLEGPKWQATRDFVVQTLGELGVSRPQWQRLEEPILEEIDYLTKSFENEGKAFDPSKKLYPATMSIVGYVTMGKRFEYDSQEFKELTARIDELFETLAGSILQSYPWLRFVPGPLRKKWKSVVYTVRKEWELVERQISKHEATYTDSRMRDFIDAYIRHVRKLDIKSPIAFENKNDLITTIEVMFSAGPEATATALLWGILYLCYNPDIQRKVQDELDQVIGRGNPITMKDQDRIPYTVATMYEIFRLGGNNPLGVLRSNFEDTELLGYDIPKRSFVIPNIWAAHRDPTYFPDPMTFKPERFLNGDGQVQVPPQFILFSIGKRSCPGEQLAKMMVYMLFANMFHRFEFRAAPGEKLPPTNEWRAGVSARTLPYKILAIPRL